MISNKKVVMSIPLLLAIVSASAVASFSMSGQSLLPSAYAAAATDNNHNNNNKDTSHKQDKVKVNCNDLAVVLVALKFSADNLSKDERDNVDSSLNEGQVSSDLQFILDHNLVDLLHKAQQSCGDKQIQEILGFIK
jgi:hypothetical protein